MLALFLMAAALSPAAERLVEAAVRPPEIFRIAPGETQIAAAAASSSPGPSAPGAKKIADALSPTADRFVGAVVRTPEIFRTAPGETQYAAALSPSAGPSSAPGAKKIAAALSPAADRFVGAVVRADAPNRALLVQLDGGGEKWIAVPQELEILRIAPGKTEIAKAAKIAFDEVLAGDRVLARTASEASGVAIAGEIVVVSRAELARRHAAERSEWKARGIAGKVTAIEPGKNEIAILTSSRPASTAMIIQVTGSTEQRRYRANSARYTDAAPSSFAEIRTGDQVQALGERTSDGTRLAAEKLVSGSFRNFAGKAAAVNPEAREITVERSDGGPAAVVKIGAACVLRRLSPEKAAALARRSEDPQSILENSPAFAIEELKPGDALIIATGAHETGGGARVPAIAVIAGVEPLLKQAGKGRREVFGSWNLALDPDSNGNGNH